MSLLNLPSNRRSQPRTSASMDARIILPNGAVIPCRTVDVSQGGARLEFGKRMVLPSAFSVEIGEGPRRRARVVWFGTTTVGIKYASLLIIGEAD